MNRRDVINAFALTSIDTLPMISHGGALAEVVLPQRDDVDNTEQLQSKIDAQQRIGGGILLLRPGTYRVRELRLKSGVRLVGLGRVTLKLFNPGRDGYIVRIIGQHSIALEHLCFDCTTEAGIENNLGCVEVSSDGNTQSSNIDFHQCTFNNAQNNAWIILRGAVNIGIKGCTFSNHLRETEGGTHGLSIAESSSAVCITDCLFDHTSAYPSRSPSRGHIGIDRANDVWIDRCIIQNAVLNGITIEDNKEKEVQVIRITGCTIRGCGNSGIQIEGNGSIILNVSNCHLENNREYGIRLASGNFFLGHINDCDFINNGRPSLENGSSQLIINLKPKQIANVKGCNFHTESKEINSVHLFYLNGEVNVSDCSFLGGVNGFGIFSTVDSEKQLERTTAVLKDLRFIDVGTPTFRIPQRFGRSWLNESEGNKYIETLLSRKVRANQYEKILALWIPIIDKADYGAALMNVSILANGYMGAKHDTFQFVIKRYKDNELSISTPLKTKSPEKQDDFNIHTLNIDLLISPNSDNVASQANLEVKVSAPDWQDGSELSITASVEVIWNGFATSPVLI